MESLLARYRNLVVLLAVLVAQIAGLAVQVRRGSGGHNSLNAQDSSGVRLIRFWAQSLVSPPERLIHGSRLDAASLWSGYIDLRHVRQQNQTLQQTISRLRLEQAELLEDAHQGQRLQALLGFQQRYIYSTVPAQVFGTSGSEQAKVFYIDKGADDGLKRDMPVISPDGIVGKLRDVFPHTAQVLAINDQTSGAGVILATTRIRGVLTGNAAGQLEVVGIMADERIKPGEKVLTAGGDLIFPRGLPVGTVRKVVPDPDRDSFIDVMVTPAAHLDRLDEVLVITSTQPRFPAIDKKDMAASEKLDGAQAAQMQAQLQAQIAQQMKASEIMAERLPGLSDPNAPPGTALPVPAPPAGANQTVPSQANPGKGLDLSIPPIKLLPTIHPDRLSPPASADDASAPQASASESTALNGKPVNKPNSTSRPTKANSRRAPTAAAGAGRTP